MSSTSVSLETTRGARIPRLRTIDEVTASTNGFCRKRTLNCSPAQQHQRPSKQSLTRKSCSFAPKKPSREHAPSHTNWTHSANTQTLTHMYCANSVVGPDDVIAMERHVSNKHLPIEKDMRLDNVWSSQVHAHSREPLDCVFPHITLYIANTQLTTFHAVNFYLTCYGKFY